MQPFGSKLVPVSLNLLLSLGLNLAFFLPQVHPHPAMSWAPACFPSRAAAGTATEASGTAARTTGRSRRAGGGSAHQSFRLELRDWG